MEYFQLFVTLIILQLTASRRLAPEQSEYQQQQQQYQQPPKHYQRPQQLNPQHLQIVHPHEQLIPIEEQQNLQQLRTSDDWTFDKLTKLLILPGTHWCGVGNNLKSYSHIGTFTEVDICCRDHDHCENIPVSESKHNLTNTSGFTLSHCDCDYMLQRCLKKIESPLSNFVGKIYFDNPFRMICYTFGYPFFECTKKVTFLNFINRCIQWTFNEKEEPLYHWIPLPLYDSTMHTIERNAINEFVYNIVDDQTFT